MTLEEYLTWALYLGYVPRTDLFRRECVEGMDAKRTVKHILDTLGVRHNGDLDSPENVADVCWIHCLVGKMKCVFMCPSPASYHAFLANIICILKKTDCIVLKVRHYLRHDS